VAGDRHHELLNQTIKLAAQAVSDNRELIRQRVRAATPWWVPGLIDERIYRRIVAATDQLLQEISSDPAHPLRAKFDQALRDFVDRLQHSPEASARAEALKEEWLSEEAVAELIGWVWDSTRRAVTGYAARPDGSDPGPLARGLSTLGQTLLDNPRQLADVEELVVEGVGEVVEQHRHEVADLIAQTVARWDAEATSRRMELAVGRDLQFVRINGTLVGGLVGLLLYAVPRFFR